jgi:hypothetical protein
MGSPHLDLDPAGPRRGSRDGQAAGATLEATLEATVRAETPRAYVDLNLDAVAAGFRMAEHVGVRV